MPETLPLQQVPDQQPDIRPGEEGYIQDSEKAMVMAYASKGAEEAAVEANNAALDTSSRIGEGGWAHDQALKLQAGHQFRVAEKARGKADEHADAAASVYDKLTNAVMEPATKVASVLDQNTEKARVMGFAAGAKIDAARQARDAGLEAAMHLGEKKWRSNKSEVQPAAGEDSQEASRAERFKGHAKKVGKEVLRVAGMSRERSAKQETAHQTKLAERARDAANRQAEAASKVYDRFEQPSAPTSGDARKAELMGRAASGKEQEAARSRQLGLEAAARLGESGLSGLATKAEIFYHTKAYERAKNSAKAKASAAGKAYDRAQKFRTRNHYKPAA